jgi:choline kinase
MKAIVLSAGQGKRLLPFTATKPKCLLEVCEGRPVLDQQLQTLSRCGVERATVLTGFGADHVDRFIEGSRFGPMNVETLYNPFYSVTDNLATCWFARSAMIEDFILLNGDTLFGDELLLRVLGAPHAPVNVTIDCKDDYDADDMKVSLDTEGRLCAIGKKLPPHTVDGESIGMLLFRGTGVELYRDALDRAIRQPESMHNWYLSVVNEMAQKMTVDTISIEGHWWAEIDSPDDLDAVRSHYLQPEATLRTARSAD